MILQKEDLKTEELNSKLQNSNNHRLNKNIFVNCLVISSIERIRQFFLKNLELNKKVLLFFLIYFLIALDYTIHLLKKCKKKFKKSVDKKIK